MRGGCGDSQRSRWTRRRVVLFSTLALSIAAMASHGTARARPPAHDAWILVDTSSETLSVFRGNELVERFHSIAIGRGGLSMGRTRGDGTTPLGTFHINRIHPSARFELFFGIDFPRPEHARRAFDAGRIGPRDYERIVAAYERNQPPPQDTALGGALGIHGLGDGSKRVHEALNWTQGCIALTNRQIRRLYRWVHLGMRVEVR